MSVINLAERYSPKVAERFTRESITDAHAGKDYEFNGVDTIKIYSVDAVPLGDYQRSGTARFGNISELGDTVQTMVLSQDKAFTFSVDKGNKVQQMNVKQINQRLKANIDEVVTPAIDQYRLAKWTAGAGLVAPGAAAPDKETIIERIMLATAAMSNKLVPRKHRTLFIRESLYVKAKLASEVVGIDTLGTKAVQGGVVGTLDGMPIVVAPDVYLPNGVNFLIKHKSATVDPMQLKTMRVHTDPPGINGDLAEFRIIHDSFVLGSKVNGLYVDADTAAVVANPNIAIAAGKATITCGTSGATIKYTTDGTDPKTSDKALTYSVAVTVAAGTKVRAFASKAGLMNSGVTEAEA